MGLCETVFVLDHGEKIAEGPPGLIQADERVIEAYFGPLSGRRSRALAIAPARRRSAVVDASRGWRGWRARCGWPLVHDAPLMHYVAWRIAEGRGAVPRSVRHELSRRVPAAPARGARRWATGDLAWRAFDLAWLAAARWRSRRFAAPWGAAGGGRRRRSLFALYHLAGGAWQAGQRDFLLCPLLLGSARSAWRAGWSRRRRAARPGLGRPRPGRVADDQAAHRRARGRARPCMVARGRLAGRRRRRRAARDLRRRRRRGAGSRVVAWLGAAGAPAGAGATIVFDYLVPLYSRLGRAAAWTSIALAVWIPLARRRRCCRWPARSPAAALGARHAVAAARRRSTASSTSSAQGKGWEYHLYPLAAFAAVLLVAELEPALARRSAGARVAVAAAAGRRARARAARRQGAGGERRPAGSAPRRARVRALAARAGARGCAPGDTVQVLDTDRAAASTRCCGCGVRQPTRFLYDFHFFHDAERAR